MEPEIIFSKEDGSIVAKTIEIKEVENVIKKNTPAELRGQRENLYAKLTSIEKEIEFINILLEKSAEIGVPESIEKEETYESEV